MTFYKMQNLILFCSVSLGEKIKVAILGDMNSH